MKQVIKDRDSTTITINELQSSVYCIVAINDVTKLLIFHSAYWQAINLITGHVDYSDFDSLQNICKYLLDRGYELYAGTKTEEALNFILNL